MCFAAFFRMLASLIGGSKSVDLNRRGIENSTELGSSSDRLNLSCLDKPTTPSSTVPGMALRINGTVVERHECSCWKGGIATE